MVGRKTILINDKEVPIRSYEVSIWTLQDSFITVLKWAGIDNKGLILEPKMTLDIDGTLEFSFSIPMYLEEGIENPIWYNTSNGNLMMGMRKIKVILNKQEENEAVFEFLITKVTEKHEANILTCEVECEGLAFHELGKIGYKINFSGELFQLDYEEWFNTGKWLGQTTQEIPKQDLKYWNTKTDFLLPYPENINDIIPNKWYYKIEMSNDNAGAGAYEIIDLVYEEAYVSSWELQNDILVPSAVEGSKIKERTVEISESNLYNITLKIAETFGVFCKYKYNYDANYHIIGRTVIYYNNFIEELNGHMDLTYPYHTSDITREIDSTELVTKLFVRPVDYKYTDSNQVGIMDVDANKSREDYILNFDYLHKFNIISDDLYAGIEEYETLLHSKNIAIEKIEPLLLILENKITEYEAKIKVADNGKTEATNQYNTALSHIDALPGNSGIVTITTKAPKLVVVLTDETDNSLYVKMPFNGIIPETVKLYDGTIDYTKENSLEDATVVNGVLEFNDEFNDLIKITHLWVETSDANYSINKSLWLVCQYNSRTYWEKVRDIWGQRLKLIESKLKKYEKILDILKIKKELLETTKNNLLKEKNIIIKDFEEMMGPALREGYWQPDDFKDYGNKYLIVNSNNQFTEGILNYNLTNDIAYEGNTKLDYLVGEIPHKYLVVNINGIKPEFLKDAYFIYYDIHRLKILLNSEINENYKNLYKTNALRLIRIGGEGCRFSYVKNENESFAALVIEASKFMSTDLLNFFTLTDIYAEEEYKEYKSLIGHITFDSEGAFTIEDGARIVEPNVYGGEGIGNTALLIEVYPRITIDSLNLKTDESSLLIKFNDYLLKEYEDYIIHIENNFINEEQLLQLELNDIEELDYRDEYIIDIKPEVYIKIKNYNPIISISYELSNASTLIYLDAVQVAKENSEPKVSYNIKLSLYDPYIIHTIYNKLSKIVHINDIQLKFENVLGYISHIEMNLDTPWEDNIEIKNYKTKFEDLFSTIVAQTSAMLKNSPGYNTAAAAFTTDGGLTSNAVIKMLNDNEPLFKTYIDEKLTDNLVIRNTLKEVFNEAGSILGSAGSAISDIRALTSRNADILASFAEDATLGLTLVRVDESGIFMGSDLRISLFSGDIIGNGVSIDLDPLRLLLGASSKVAGSTAAKFTDNYIVLAAGDVIADSEELISTVINEGEEEEETILVPKKDLESLGVTGTINGLVGAKFTKDSIGLATSSNNVINAILMNDNGITLGHGVNVTQSTADLKESKGSVIRISGEGIILGSGAELYINTANFKLRTGAKDDTPMFLLNKTVIDENDNSTSYVPVLTYSEKGGLTISGNLSADSLVIDNNNTQQAFNDWVNAQVTPDRIWLGIKAATLLPADGEQPSADRLTSCLSITDNNISILSGGSFNISSNGNLNISAGQGQTAANLNITSGGNFNISSGGNINISSNNLVINSAAGNGQSIFKLTNGAENNPLNYLNLAKDSSGELFAQIAGWTLSEHKLLSGSNDNNTYVALDSGTTDENYAIWAGNRSSSSADFRVRRDGKVYIHSLMVLDSRPINGGSWGLGGDDNDHDERHDGVAENGEDTTLYYGYKAIDFSKLNFKQAVSVNGNWSGSEFLVKVSLWGILNKSVNMSAGVTVSDITSPGYIGHSLLLSVKLTLSINGDDKSETKEIGTVDVPDSYKDYVWGLAAGKVSYTSGSKSVTVPASGMGNTNSLNISDTYDAGVNSVKLGTKTVTYTANGNYRLSPNSGDSGISSASITVNVSTSTPSGCFIAGTPVLLADYTTIPIEKLQLGMEVLGYDEETQSFKSTYVELLQHIHDRDLNIVDIYLSSGDIITMTEEHPLLTIDGWKALDLELAKSVYGVEATMLEIGDLFISANNTIIKVNQIIKRPDLSHTSVYHLDVEPYDTYVVKNIIAHNPGENSDK